MNNINNCYVLMFFLGAGFCTNSLHSFSDLNFSDHESNAKKSDDEIILLSENSQDDSSDLSDSNFDIADRLLNIDESTKKICKISEEMNLKLNQIEENQKILLKNNLNDLENFKSQKYQSNICKKIIGISASIAIPVAVSIIMNKYFSI